MVPLRSTKDRYCPKHEHKKLECVVRDCTQPAVPGRLTCTDPDHSEREDWRNMEHKSMHSMARRRDGLKHSTVVPFPLIDAGETDEAADAYTRKLLDRFGCQTDAKADEGNKQKPSILFARNWTHNEQILVAPCGVIVAVVTMQGSEALDSVRVRLYFPHFLNTC
jgi:hypothetical protein